MLEPYSNLYVNASQGEGDATGPWNEGEQWEKLDDIQGNLPLDGGDGTASVDIPKKQMGAVEAMMTRLQSVPEANPTTGADLGAGPGAGKLTDEDMGGAADMTEAKSMADAKASK